MSEKQQAPAYSDDQLHARACIICDRTDGELLSAGYLPIENRPGQHLPWAVVACPDHAGAGS